MHVGATGPRVPGESAASPLRAGVRRVKLVEVALHVLGGAAVQQAEAPLDLRGIASGKRGEHPAEQVVRLLGRPDIGVDEAGQGGHGARALQAGIAL